jgi:hypothetical protein
MHFFFFHALHPWYDSNSEYLKFSDLSDFAEYNSNFDLLGIWNSESLSQQSKSGTEAQAGVRLKSRIYNHHNPSALHIPVVLSRTYHSES